MTAASPLPPEPGLVRNASLVARREFGAQVRSRLFAVSTGLLAVLAVAVSLTPVLIKMADRGTSTTIAVTSEDNELITDSIAILDGFLNPPSKPGVADLYTFVPAAPEKATANDVAGGGYQGVVIVTRRATGQISVQLLAGERLGPDRMQPIQIGALAIAIFDWQKHNGNGVSGFNVPEFQSAAVSSAPGEAANPSTPPSTPGGGSSASCSSS